MPSSKFQFIFNKKQFDKNKRNQNWVIVIGYLKPSECPTDFGQFARKAICSKECHLKAQCKKATKTDKSLNQIFKECEDEDFNAFHRYASFQAEWDEEEKLSRATEIIKYHKLSTFLIYLT